VELAIRETGIELTIETRGHAHLERVLSDLRAAGFEVDGAD